MFSKSVNELINLQKNDILEKAIHLFLSGTYQEAEDYLLTTYPENAFNEDSPALTVMGHIQMKLEQFESAKEYFRQASKVVTEKDSYFIYDGLGMTFYMNSDYQNSILNFEKAKNEFPSNSHLSYHMALVNETLLQIKLEQHNENLGMSEAGSVNKNKDREQALKEIKDLRDKLKETYSDIITNNPNFYPALLNAGTLNANEGLPSAAEAYYQKALVLNQKDWKVNLNLAYLKMLEKEYKPSLEFFERAMTTLGKTDELKILMPYMFVLYKNESWKKLEMICKHVLKIDKKNKSALVFLCSALKNNRKYKELLGILKKLKKKIKKIKRDTNIDEKDTTNQLSLHYTKIKKKIRQDLKELKKAIKNSEDNINGINQERDAKRLSEFANIAKLDLDNINSFGFDEKEIMNLLTSYKKDNNNIDALYHLGIITFKEEVFDKSEEFLLKVHNMDPNYERSSVCQCLGDINLIAYKKPKEALDYFSKTLEKEDNELIQVKIGACLELLGENDKALEHYKKSYEQNKEFPSAIFHIGCLLDKKGDKEAMQWFEMAYEKEKENVEYLRKYGDILVRSDDDQNIKKGILILEKGLEFFTGNVDIMSSLAIGYEKESNIKEAIKLLEQANNDPLFFNNKSKVFQLASYYEKVQDFSKAVDFFKNVLVLDRENIEALLHIGYIYKSCKEFVKAYKCFNKILEIQPENIHAHYGLGRIFQLMNTKDEESIKHFLKCLEIDENFDKAGIQLAIIYLKLKKLDESLNILKKIHEKDKNNTLCLTTMGNVFIDKKQYEEAEKYLKLAYNIDKKSVTICASLGDTYYGLKKLDEAINKYLQTIKLGGDIPEVHFSLGHCYYIKDKFEPSINHYIEALKLVKNTRHDYYYYLGNALVAGGRIKDGIRAYQAAIKIKNTKLIYYYVLGRTCYLDKEYNYAIKCLEKLVKLLNNLTPEEKVKILPESEVQFLLFKCLSSLPTIDSSKCLGLLHNLMNNDPKNIKYIDCLAGLYEKTNQTLDAIKTYKKILKIDPSNEEAKNNLKRLEDREEGNYYEKKGKKK